MHGKTNGILPSACLIFPIPAPSRRESDLYQLPIAEIMNSVLANIGSPLLTSDRRIHAEYPDAIW